MDIRIKQNRGPVLITVLPAMELMAGFEPALFPYSL